MCKPPLPELGMTYLSLWEHICLRIVFYQIFSRFLMICLLEAVISITRRKFLSWLNRPARATPAIFLSVFGKTWPTWTFTTVNKWIVETELSMKMIIIIYILLFCNCLSHYYANMMLSTEQVCNAHIQNSSKQKYAILPQWAMIPEFTILSQLREGGAKYALDCTLKRYRYISLTDR